MNWKQCESVYLLVLQMDVSVVFDGGYTIEMTWLYESYIRT